METGLERILSALPAIRPESLVMLGKALQAIGEDLGAAQQVAPPWQPCILPPVPAKDLSVFRVSVNRPRPGRDGGEWCLRIRYPGRTKVDRVMTGIKAAPETRAEAEELARVREHELNCGGQATFIELYDMWVESQRAAKVRPNTLVAYRDSRPWLLKCGLASLKDGELSRGAVRRARERICAAMKTTSASIRLSHMRQAWKWAWREELLVQEWIDMGPLKIPKADKTQKKAYKDQEILALLEFFRSAGRPRGRYFVYFWALAETGARADAMANVKGRHVSHDAHTGGAWIEVAQETVKTGEGRALLVGPALAAKLPRVGPDDYLWPSKTRGGEPRPLNYSNVTAIIRKWLKANGLFGRRDLHSLRRTAVHNLLDAGHGVEKARRVTGHSAKQFAAYAEKGHHDLAAVFSCLWLDPLGTKIGVRQFPLLHSENPEQQETHGATLTGPNSPIQAWKSRAETEVLSALRFAVNELGGWPQALSMVQRCLLRLRSEQPPKL